MKTLADLLQSVERGRFPEADGGLTIVPQPSARDLGVIAFTAHTVVFADVPPGWIRDRLPPGDLSAPLCPPFLRALSERTGRRAAGTDLLSLAMPLPGPSPVPVEEVTGSDHPRVARARRHRDAVRVWTTEDGGALLAVGRGVAGRWEVAVEVEPAHRGRGLGRLLAGAARRLVPEPVWAQVAPGNAASVRAFLAAGYVPVGAEALFPAP
ncbi:GNAT family N-acetyltransferase [Nonomuraea sp. NPDC050643]|uniref:GNAT family N-acetyltransferase n=1 Tax=Nonomuraea sp. NPDC050643 TaxID=3155660 RepID=UPI0033C64F11